VFPAGATLAAGEYAVVCSSTRAGLFAGFGRVFGLTSFPALTNAGDQLLLRGRDGRTIFEISYSDTWYRDNVKRNGGWTLEMVDPSNPCAGISNWAASTDPRGGTPAAPNSVRAANADRTPPALLRAVALNASTVRLTFSEKLDSAQVANTALYTLQPANAVRSVTAVAHDFRSVDLALTTPLQLNVPTTVNVQRATDCVGNASGPLTSSTFALPVAPAAGEVVINEVLFDPRSGGFDFVELLNRTDKYLNLQGAELGREVAGVAEYKSISAEPLVLAPGQLLVLTENPEAVQAQYPTHDAAAFQRLASLPTYPDDNGVVLVRNAQQVLLDRFEYDKNMHLALLSTSEGVSLERIRPDGPTVAANFHSAAGSVGYATPGRRNSQVQPDPSGNKQFTVEPEVFSPDDDGQNDFTTLNYQLTEPGYAGSITIYDAQGRLARRLVRNETLATNGFFRWDGLTDSGRKAPIGYYVLHIELYKPGGGAKSEYKKTVVLGARLR
jgi:hypothetical protein